MNCWRVQNLIAPFLDGELLDAECDAVAEHMEQCDECRELIDAVDQLPPLPRLEVDPEVERELFAGFDEQLAERIARSLADEEEPLRKVANGGFVGSLLRGEVRVPVALVAAYVGVVVLLGGGILLNHQRVQDLQASVQERDALISAINRANQAERAQDVFLAGAQTEEPAYVFMPAGATDITGLPAASPLPGIRSVSYQVGSPIAPANLRRTADAPRVVH
jgi:anti-sigma factor RsiW